MEDTVRTVGVTHSRAEALHHKCGLVQRTAEIFSGKVMGMLRNSGDWEKSEGPPTVRSSPDPGRKYKHCCWHRDRGAHVHATPAVSSHGYRFVESDLDRPSNSVIDLVNEGSLDEAEGACEQQSPFERPHWYWICSKQQLRVFD